MRVCGLNRIIKNASPFFALYLCVFLCYRDGNEEEEHNYDGYDYDDGSESGRGGEAGYGDLTTFERRFRKLNEEICDVVDSFSLVGFLPLNIQVNR